MTGLFNVAFKCIALNGEYVGELIIWLVIHQTTSVPAVIAVVSSDY